MAFGREPQILVLTKANSASPVHRPAYLDYIGVKKYGSEGRPRGERRFLGLYTTYAYKASPRSIPIIRGKVDGVLQHAGFPPASHDRKALEEILESYPRDSLFQMETGELFNVAIGILGLGERQRLRLFMWRDPLDRFVECLVCIPRDRFNTENRERVGRILLEALGGVALDWTLQLSESRLVRVHYIIRCAELPAHDYDVATIETRLVQAVRAWTDDLRDALLEEHGEEDGTQAVQALRARVPARLSGRLGGTLGGRRHRPDRGARADRRADHQPVPPARGARGDRAPQAVQRRGRAALRRAAHPRAPRREGGRRAALRDHARGPHLGVDLRLRARGRRRQPRARARPHARRVRRRVARRARGRRPQRTGPGRHPGGTARSRSSAPSPSICARAGSASRTRTSSAPSSPTPTSPGFWSSCSPRGWTRIGPTAIRPTGSRPRSTRRSTPSRASTRTGSCAAS